MFNHTPPYTMFLRVAQTSPYVIGFLGVVMALFVKSPIAYQFVVTYLVIGVFSNWIIKEILKLFFTGHPAFERPTPPSTGCGIFDNCGDKKKTTRTFGMPSGHAQSIAFAAMFATLYVLQNNAYTNKVVYIAGFWLFALFVMWSRVHIGCHTTLQVVVGALIGAIFAYFCFHTTKYFEYK